MWTVWASSSSGCNHLILSLQLVAGLWTFRLFPVTLSGRYMLQDGSCLSIRCWLPTSPLAKRPVSLSLSLSLSLFISVIHCANVTLKWARSATKTLNVKHVCWRQDHKFTTAMHCSEGTGKQQLSIGIGLLSSAELLRLTTANESWITDSVKEWLHENRRNCLERKVIREVECQEQLFADSRNATCSF